MAADSGKLLRNALTINAAYTALCGLPLVVASGSLVGVFGLSQAWPLQAVGAFLLVVAAAMAFTAMRKPLSPILALLLTVGDVGYVLASLALITVWSEALSSTGRLIVGGVAAGVAVLVAIQLVGLRQLSAGKA